MIKKINIDQLKLNPDNPRFINEKDFDKLVKSIVEFPEMLEKRPIVVDENYNVLGGNMRLNACKKAGLNEVFINVAEGWSEEKKKEFIIKDNSSFGQWDWDVLANDWNVNELGDWGLEVPDFPQQEEAQEDYYEETDDLKVDVVLGDLIEIGDHRLLCGDSTDSDQVAKLMNGEKADMVFTDPPYGVNIKGGKLKKNLIMGDLTQTAIPFSFELSVLNATKNKSHFYFCGGESNLLLYQKLFDRYLHQLPRHLIWVKNGFVIKPNGYHNQYEIIFHGFKEGSGSLWFSGRKEHEASDVWHINRDSSSDYLHPTQKPIQLSSRAIKNSSENKGLIYDCFLGSGSTMVASHQLNRKCYGMELDPKYCQVIIDRMRKLDNNLVIKINGKEYEQN